MQVELERLQAMNLKEGDIVVYRVDHVMTRKHMDHLRDNLRNVFTNNKVVVVDSGANIQIIEDTPPKPIGPPLVDYKEGFKYGSIKSFYER